MSVWLKRLAEVGLIHIHMVTTPKTDEHVNKKKKPKQVEEQPEKLSEDSMLLVPDVAGSESGHRSSHQDTAVDVRYISQNATITRHN